MNWDEISLASNLKLLDMQPSIIIDQVNLNSLNLSENRSLTEPALILRIAQLYVSEIEFSNNHLNLDTISIARLITDIRVNSVKSILGLVDTSALTPESEDQTEISESVTDPSTSSVPTEQSISSPEIKQALTIALGKFMLVDTAYTNISDKSVSPAYEQKIIIETLQAWPFDSKNSDLKSTFELIAKDDNYLKIVAEKFNAFVNLNISELDLPHVSPYMKDGLGFEMKTGQLDVEVVIKNDEIDGETSLLLRGVDMSSSEEEEQGTIKEGKDMPLNMALGLLKDDQGNIDLGVPLRGNVAEPSFGVGSFLGLVLKKAAMSQAKNYLMTTFVPYASVVSVAISGAEYLLKVKFEPLVFQTGEVVLTQQHQQYLAELMLLMQDKPELQLKPVP